MSGRPNPQHSMLAFVDLEEPGLGTIRCGGSRRWPMRPWNGSRANAKSVSGQCGGQDPGPVSDLPVMDKVMDNARDRPDSPDPRDFAFALVHFSHLKEHGRGSTVPWHPRADW